MKLKIVPEKRPSLEQLYLLEQEYYDAKERFENAKKEAMEAYPLGGVEGPYVATFKQHERETFSYSQAKKALPLSILKKLMPFVSVCQVKIFSIDKVGEE